MKMNTAQKRVKIQTHEGGKATTLDASYQLYRAVCACLLGEETYYESGQSALTRIAELAPKVPMADVFAIATHAKQDMKMRHAPLWVMVNALPAVPYHRRAEYRRVFVDLITRPDELGEVVAMVWKNGKRPIPNTIRKALATAFRKFSAYQFAKHDHNTATIRLRDVMFLVHPKPRTPQEAELFHQIANNTLPTPQTWEVLLSTARTEEDKCRVWEGLLQESQLGALALLRNLRNMQRVGVSRTLIVEALGNMDTSRVLPFRFAAAYRNSDSFESLLDKAFMDSCRSLPVLNGRTLVLVDHSGSMSDPLSAKSDMTRAIAAQSLAAVLKEVTPDIVVFGYHNTLLPSPCPTRGLDVLNWFSGHYMGGTYTTECLNAALHMAGKFDRIIIITDEQSHSYSGLPRLSETPHKYVLNVGSYKPSISNDNWVNITGFSENIVHYLSAVERGAWL